MYIILRNGAAASRKLPSGEVDRRRGYYNPVASKFKHHDLIHLITEEELTILAVVRDNIKLTRHLWSANLS